MTPIAVGSMLDISNSLQTTYNILIWYSPWGKMMKHVSPWAPRILDLADVQSLGILIPLFFWYTNCIEHFRYFSEIFSRKSTFFWGVLLYLFHWLYRVIFFSHLAIRLLSCRPLAPGLVPHQKWTGHTQPPFPSISCNYFMMRTVHRTAAVFGGGN